MIEEIFSCGDSLLHRLDPGVKVIASFILTLVVALSQSFAAALLGLFIAIILLAAARLRLSEVFKRVLLVNTFIGFLWLTLPLTYGEENLGQLGPVNISLQGVELAALLTVKANSLVLVFIALLATSRIADIGRGLRFLGLPEKLCLLLLASYRYIFVISREYQRLNRAARLRCFVPGTNLHTYRTYGNLLGMTLVRSWDRARRVNRAMLLRGFQGKFYSGISRNRYWPDYLFLAIIAISATVVAFLNILSPDIF